MAKVLVVYFGKSGTTEKMARYVAEGVRIAGQEAEVRKASEVASERDLAGYDAYIFGCPTYHLDMPQSFASLLDAAGKAGLQGRAGGAFSPRAHPSSSDGGGAAERVYAIMESTLGMKMTELGPFDVMADVVDGPDGARACQEYGKGVAGMLG
jgi:multimeric flavodoxin WrbA